MASGNNVFRALINRRRSIEMGLAEAPKWRAWGPHTKEQASRPISESSNLRPYIVRVRRPPPSSSDDLLSYYQTFLPKTTADEESRIIRVTYTSPGCFVARLSPEEVKAMEKIPGFMYARDRPLASLIQSIGSKTCDYVGMEIKVEERVSDQNGRGK